MAARATRRACPGHPTTSVFVGVLRDKVQKAEPHSRSNDQNSVDARCQNLDHRDLAVICGITNGKRVIRTESPLAAQGDAD